MRKTVLLEHRLAAGTSHYDWMLELEEGDDPDERSLLTFHVNSRVDPMDAGSFDATRIDDHRRLYLEYEGKISGRRGEVRALASGKLLEMKFTDIELVAVIDWGSGPMEYRGRIDDSNSSHWRFNVAPVLSR
jgi:hypothetical protein